VRNQIRHLDYATRTGAITKSGELVLVDEGTHRRILSSLLKTVLVEEKVSEDDSWDCLNKWAVFST
jgi:hypothetical protein